MVQVAGIEVADRVAGSGRRASSGECIQVFVAERGSPGTPIDAVDVVVLAPVEDDEDVGRRFHIGEGITNRPCGSSEGAGSRMDAWPPASRNKFWM